MVPDNDWYLRDTTFLQKLLEIIKKYLCTSYSKGRNNYITTFSHSVINDLRQLRFFVIGFMHTIAISRFGDYKVCSGNFFRIDFVDTWPKHGAAGTLNAELHPAIKALNIEHHFKKGQYSAAYSGFEGIEDNTDRIQTREEVEAEQSAGKTLAYTGNAGR